MKDFVLRNTTKWDLISRKVSLKYNGRFRFKTLLGGIATIIIFMLLIIYLILLSVMPIKLVASSAYIFGYFSNQDTNNSSNSNQITTSGNITWNIQKELSFVNLHSLRLNNSVPLSPYPLWYFGFMLNRDYDPTYVQLYLYHSADDGKGLYYGPISFDKWVNNPAFPQYENFTSFFCPNASDISMLYAYSNGAHSKIAMNIQKWVGTGWQSDADITAWMNYTTISKRSHLGSHKEQFWL